ncbi:MAG: hypothetical protein HZB95_10100 [Nitrosomonadales bacterium]|nr:hypothetical protein [Nitrosomonadales bacterium]
MEYVAPDDSRTHKSQDRTETIKFRGAEPPDRLLLLRTPIKAVIFLPMHFSRHISQLHSTFSLLAALKLRSRAN